MRLTLAFDAGLERPGSTIVLHPSDDFDVADMKGPIVQPLKPAYDAWIARGYDTTPTRPDGRWDMAVVCITRSKDQTRDLIAWAAQNADTVVVDGQKTDGIDSHYKALRKRTDVRGTITKSHGRLFWFETMDLSDWVTTPQDVDGYVTQPGVFSADGIDPASAALVQLLPETMKGAVCDLGAGWGYLSANVLTRGCERIDLVEADHIALSCAQKNITDPRATFNWGDATRHKGRYDWVVMNPPFHRGRKGDPGLGQQFIQAAARCLAPKGHLWMVANAHLPYEATVEASFAKVEIHQLDRKFKIFQASRPRR